MSRSILSVTLERLGPAGVVVWGLAVVGCQAPIAPPEPTPSDDDPVTDQDGPTLETNPISAPQSVEAPIRIEATAADPSGIYVVTLHFKPQNTDWQSVRMDEAGAAGAFQVELTREMLNGAGSVQYYLEAADGTPYHNTSYSPSTGAENPYRFNLVY